MTHSSVRAQRGGTFLGIILGLLIGLGAALAVALYIAKVPVPFVDKVPHRTAEQDAAEAERNKNWDPNAPLAGKQGTKAPNEAASAPAATPAAEKPAAAERPVATPVADKAASAPAPRAAASAADKPRAASAPAPEAAKSSRDPAAILSGQAPTTPAATAPAKPATPAAGQDPFVYFVQAGAYSSADDAEQQRARLAMQGISAKVTEREQGGRTVHRVRLGPFETRTDAEAAQERLRGAGAEAVLVRMERAPR
jgi:cell division protein FtsN